MKKTTALRLLTPTLIFLFLFSVISQAQIYEPSGLRIPGDWNSWVNNTGMGGAFDLQKVQSGTARWQTTFQFTGTTGAQNFKFASSNASDPWGNQWAGNAAMTLNALCNVTYGTPSDPNNKITVTNNKWYTVVFEDKGYASTRCIFMQTSAQPVTIPSVSQQPLVVTNTDAVTVTATLSAAPSSEEKIYIRYTTNDWAASSCVAMNISASTGTGIIPAQNANITVKYYIFSTVITNPVQDWDLITIKLNNNNSQNYSYTVGGTTSCGQSMSLITTEPPFPVEGTPITIYLNAAYGNMGLFNYTVDVFAHTGVITNLSTSNSDWKYVKTNWGQNTPETKLTRIGDNLYSLVIPNIRTYYGVPASEQILKMAFVFRGGVAGTGGAYPEQKNADGSDIMVDVYAPSLKVKITNPTSRDPLVSPNQALSVCVSAMQNQTISLYLDQQLLQTESTSSMSYPLVLTGMVPGSYWVKAVASGTSGQARDSVNIYLRGPVVVQDLPAGVKRGINYIDNNTVTLVLNDPAGLKQFAFAIGEFSNWLPNDQNYMKRTPDGKNYWVTITGLGSQQEYAYQYYVDGLLKLADPYSDKILDPWNDKYISKFNYPNLKPYPADKTTGVVSVLETGQSAYPWEVNSFTPPAVDGRQQDLVVYELLLRDFTDSSSVAMAIEKLDYLKNLGVNAIELMPINEFDGNNSWGYAPNFYFAPDKYYGRKNDYKKFIDECHKRNMAVVLDIVTNHCFGLNPQVQMYFSTTTGGGQPSANNPWLNPQSPHPLGIGYDFNHESAATREFFKMVFAYWITDYKVDGFRFDLSKGLTQKYTGSDMGAWGAYDQSRINILTDYYNYIKGVSSKAYMILEHFADNSEEKVLANTGMMLWGGMQEHYKQVGLGWQSNSDLSWAYHANRGWNYPNIMDYMEDHDQERIMFEALSNGNSAGGYNIKDTTTALHQMQMTAALMMGIPGPKMVWQFGELGYDYSINYNGDRTAPKPCRWDYFNNPDRQRLYRVYSGLAALRKNDAFRYGTFSGDLGGLSKREWISHSSMNVVIAANMNVAGTNIAPGFSGAGNWYDYFSGETVNVTDPAGQSFAFGAGEFRIFTNVQLPRPFYTVNLTIKDSVTGAVVGTADVTFENSGHQRSNTQGKAGFTAAPGNSQLVVVKQGYKTNTRTLAVGSDLDLDILLKRDNDGIGDASGPSSVSLWPNPVHGLLNIQTLSLYNINIYSLDGRQLMQHSMLSPSETLDLSRLPKGIYVLRFTSNQEAFAVKVVVE